MRRGGRRVDWKVSEVEWLRENAGTVPLSELCRHLRRSAEAVRHMARREGLSLRHFEPRTTVCPSCGHASATLGDVGICRPCQLRRQIAAIEASTADLLARLPEEVRESYARTEAATGETRAVDPMPMPPRIDSRATHYRRMAARERYIIALEDWHIRRLTREARAAQKRKERIARKLGDQQATEN